MHYRCLALSLASIHDTPVVTTKSLSPDIGKCPQGLGGAGGVGEESTQMRTTELKQKYNRLIYKTSVLSFQKQQVR